MQMNRSNLLLKKRNAPEKRQKRGCCGSTELPIVVARRSWREISCGKLGTLIQQTKNSLNFVSTCLKVVDTRRYSHLGERFQESNFHSKKTEDPNPLVVATCRGNMPICRQSIQK